MAKRDEITHSILIVSGSEQFAAAVQGCLPERKYISVERRSDAASARRFLLERYYDIVVINAPLPDESGLELALDTAEGGQASILFAVPAVAYEDVRSRLNDRGILAVPKPVSREDMSRGIRFLMAVQVKIRRLEQKLAAAQEKLEEMRIVNKAKFMLVETGQMGEDEAHRLIGKMAMDHGISRRRAAERLLEEME